MSPDKSLQNLFNAALEQSDAAERARFLDEACGVDAALRERVERLLRAQEEVGAFMAQPSRKPAGLDLNPTARVIIPLTEKPGDLIGRYKLLQQIGEGGCGVVYMAEQEEPVRRRVALKVIKLGMDTKQVIARFEAERQALALMDHPNIAKVLDAGATETGRPYFVMELVRGLKITEFCDQKELPTQERLDLFLQVCSAVQHAHQKGIIHRDIKPSNILVTVVDAVPVPKVIDFGIAKATNNQPLTDKTVFTAFEQFIGTPAYMSPEQAELSGVDIDTRTDIYSLGVVLYELLTGSPPFDQKELLAAGLDEMRRIIRETEPPRPSNRLSTMAAAALTTTAHHRHTEPPRLVHLVRGDLDWIAMKCLEKDRARRYETATALAADIQRHLSCEPVVARPPSRLYEFQKTVKRHKVGFAAAAAVILALAVGLGISMWTLVKEKQARGRAVAAEREQIRLRRQAEANEQKAESAAATSAQVAQFMKDMLGGVGPAVAMGRDTALLKEILDKTAGRIGVDLKNQPAVEAQLRQTLGTTYTEIGDYTNANAMLGQALLLWKQVRGDDSDAAARVLNNLGLLRYRQGKWTEAEGLYRQELAMRKRLDEQESREVAIALNDLGEALRRQDKLAEAETLFQEALAMRKKLLGDEHIDVTSSLYNLGTLLWSQQRYPEAEKAYREALAIRRKLLGENHPWVASSLNGLGQVLGSAGRHGEAEMVYREALAMYRKVYGEHPDVAHPLGNLAGTLAEQEKFQEAESLVAEALAIRSKWLPPDHPDLAQTRITQHDILWRQGKLFDSAYYREEVAFQRKVYGETHRNVSKALDYLGRSLEAEGKLAEAEAVMREDVVVQKRLDGDEHPWVANSLHALAVVLLKAGRHSEAEPVFREALEIRRKSLGNEHPQTRTSLVWLGLTQQGQGKRGEAVAFLREELDHAGTADWKGWASTNSWLGVVLHHFAEALWIQKAFKAARPPAEEAWALYEQYPGWPEGERSHAYHVLHAVLTDLNDRPALESLERKMLVHRRAQLPVEHRQALAIHQSLALNTTNRVDAQALNEAAWLLATCEEAVFRDGPRAVQMAEKAVRLKDRKDPMILDTLAAAYAETGEFALAVGVQKEAITLLSDEEQKKDFTSRLKLYEANTPYRQMLQTSNSQNQ